MSPPTAPSTETRADSASLRLGEVTRIWWPLAMSWLMMGLEMPAITAVVARLAEPKVNLAAYGAVVFPLALLIEAPIIMMLAASTTWCRDEPSYRRLYRFMWRLSALLTATHVLIAFTPLYDVVVSGLIGVPEEIVEPGRLGLRIMTPWTWAIADRRFHQGVLIRFGRARSVGIGTMVRMGATSSVLAAGFLLGTLPGIVVASAALSVGVLIEMLYARIAVAPVLHGPLRAAEPRAISLSLGSLLRFYVPLALTPLLGLLAQPLGSAAMSRMPDPITSLAAWPALGGLVFLTRSVGMAYNEVVVSCCERPGAVAVLWRFTLLLAAGTAGTLVLLAASPLGTAWFAGVCGLDEGITALAGSALWLGILMPALTALHSFYQGVLVHAQRTRAIPESMVLFLVVSAVLLGAGIAIGRFPGVSVTLVAFTAGATAQALWLFYRARLLIAELGSAPAPDAEPAPRAPSCELVDP